MTTTQDITTWHQHNSIAPDGAYRVLLELTRLADHRGTTYTGDRAWWAVDKAPTLGLFLFDVYDAFHQLRELGELQWNPATGTCTFPAYPGFAGGPAPGTSPPVLTDQHPE